MKELVLDLKQKVNVLKQGGGEQAIKRHLARGKLLPRIRIERLLDEGYESEPGCDIIMAPHMVFLSDRRF
jgi:acetyl-CoA carboxylase carboxyltransferase component